MKNMRGSVLCESCGNYNIESTERHHVDPILIRSMIETVDRNSQRRQENIRYMSGNVSGIPSLCKVPPLSRHEKLVIGSHVDMAIVPGYRYAVRINGSNEFLFDGQSKYLESIGRGCCKRMTFEGDGILNNDNFFWPNTSPTGYAFSICVLQPSDEFRVFENDQEIGSAYVERVSGDQEMIRSEYDVNNSERRSEYDVNKSKHVKEVQVNFTCSFNLRQLQDTFSSEVSGMVRVTKHCDDTRSVLGQIMALLLPSGKVLVLKPEV